MRYIWILCALVAFFGYMAAMTVDAYGATNPPTIEECRSDLECDIAARILCEAGLIEWCMKEA